MSKKSIRTTLRDIYEKGNLKDIIEYQVYKEIWQEFAKVFEHELITSGKCYKLPKLLGTLQIRRRKTKPKSRIDFVKTKELGFTVYFDNKHTDGYYVFLHWDISRPNCQMPFKKIYKIELLRHGSRFLSKYVREGQRINKYFEYN